MLTLTDLGGAVLCFVVLAILLFSRSLVAKHVTRNTKYLRAALLWLALLFGSVGAIYAAFAVGGSDIDTDYSIGNAVRPWAKAADGIAAGVFAYVVYRWARPAFTSRAHAGKEMQ